MYQIQDVDTPGSLAALEASEYPMLVLEPGHNFRPCDPSFDPAAHGIEERFRDTACAEPYDTAAIVDRLRSTPDGTQRLLIAYIDIGQAEWYRDYWVEGWAAPGASSGGSPSFILAADPDEWLGNFVVDYTDPSWQALWLGEDGIVAELARVGFDGVYLDWVEAYDDERAQAAIGGGVAAAADAMVRFIERIGDAGRAVTPDFLVIAQNATYLLDDASDGASYAAAIDALAVEDTWFYGNGSAGWDDVDTAARFACEMSDCSRAIVAPDNVCSDDNDTSHCPRVSGDLHGGVRHGCDPGAEGTSGCWSTTNRLAAYERYRAAGRPVFTIDYCISADNAAAVYRDARALGLRPLVSRVQLSRMTDTPPP